MTSQYRAPLLPRLHIWLGWLIGVPLLLWTGTGLWMVARPIEEVRGTALRAETSALAATLVPLMPRLDGRPVERIELTARVDRPVWVIHFADADMRAADATTGALLPPVDAALARRIADAALVTPSAVVGLARFAADANPIELRRERPAWQVRYADGLNVYVDADSGAVLALRSRQWRLFDLMWGLHIMDVQTREDTHHPLLVGFAGAAFLSVLIGVWLLFRRRRARAQP